MKRCGALGFEIRARDPTKAAAAPQQRLGEIVPIRAPVRGRTEAAGAPRRTLQFRRSLTGARIETVRPAKAHISAEVAPSRVLLLITSRSG
jgi:hypothetical protein